VRFSLTTAPALAVVATTIGIVAFATYATRTDWLLRQSSRGPATHPLTALSIAFLGVGALFALRRGRTYVALVLAILVIGITLARLSVLVSGDWTAFQALTPFPNILADHAGAPIRMGANTAVTLLLAAIAMLFRSQRKLKTAQIVALAATSIPLVGLTGYIYGISSFYGQMAPLTIAGALCASLGILLSTAHRGLLRGLLSPWPAGRLARMQICILTGAYFLLGFIICRMHLNAEPRNFAVETVLMSFLVIIVIGFSANIYERLDQGRRQAEHDREEAATRDFLTGFRNRRSFFAEAEKFWNTDNNQTSPISALMIDIDHFKAINDGFGHDAGDSILRWIGSFLPRKMASSAVIARIGGEEFAVLLPGAELNDAKLLAETIRCQIAEADLSEIVSGLDRITASIGIATGSRKTHGVRRLLAEADAALYRAKDAGRNRTEI
jgi:diguanylate cyclase (GGDEF)-like protein